MIPCTRYEVVKTADAQGGSTETMGEATTIWVDGVIPGEELAVELDGRESVNQGDILEFTDEL